MRFEKFEKENLNRVLDKDAVLKLMYAYKSVFEGPPWFEEWSLEEVRKVIKETIFKKETTKGELLFQKGKDEKLIGFIWGYGFIEDGKPVISPTVDFKKVISIVKEKGYDPEVSFYLAEFGIIPEKQNKGYGFNLLSDFVLYLKENDEKYVFYRTINPVVLYLTEKLEKYGKIKAIKRNLFEDPRYKERKWQLVIL